MCLNRYTKRALISLVTQIFKKKKKKNKFYCFLFLKRNWTKSKNTKFVASWQRILSFEKIRSIYKFYYLKFINFINYVVINIIDSHN